MGIDFSHLMHHLQHDEITILILLLGITNWVCDRTWGNGTWIWNLGLSLSNFTNHEYISKLSCVFLSCFSLTVKTLSIRNRWNCFPSWLCHLPAVWTWTSHFVSLSLSPLPVKWSFLCLSHGLLCGWNDVIQTKRLTQCVARTASLWDGPCCHDDA